MKTYYEHLSEYEAKHGNAARIELQEFFRVVFHEAWMRFPIPNVSASGSTAFAVVENLQKEVQAISELEFDRYERLFVEHQKLLEEYAALSERVDRMSSALNLILLESEGKK